MRALCLLVLTSLWLPAAAAAEGLASPESALVVDGDVYVSNMGARPAPSVADGDGYIARLAPDGSVQDSRYLPTGGELNAPKGMAVIGPVLYVADIDRIVGFDLASREQVFELSLADTGTRFLNDLAAAGPNLMVSATDIDTVFEVDPAREQYRPVMRFVRAPNGLYYDSERRWLYVAGYGRNGRDGELGLVRLDTRIPTYRRLGLRGRLDGIARIGEWLVVTDWGDGKQDGRLHAYHLGSERVRRDILTGLQGPADLAADAQSGRVWLPEMLGNRLRVEEVELAR
jgi:hypothetical protein